AVRLSVDAPVNRDLGAGRDLGPGPGAHGEHRDDERAADDDEGPDLHDASLLPMPSVDIRAAMASSRTLTLRWYTIVVPRRSAWTRSASRRMRRWPEMVGQAWSNRAAMSPAVMSSPRRIARILRRVGSE